MDFNFTDDQEQLRDAVRKWVGKGYGFDRRKGIMHRAGFPARLMANSRTWA